VNQPENINSRVMAGIVLVMTLFFAAACDRGAPRIGIEGVQAQMSPLISGSATVSLLIENTGNSADSLERAFVDVPGSLTELHAYEDGKMQAAKRIDIPAGKAVHLKLTADHIMIYKLPPDIKEGTQRTLTLVFKKTGQVKTPLLFSIAR